MYINSNLPLLRQHNFQFQKKEIRHTDLTGHQTSGNKSQVNSIIDDEHISEL